MKLHHLKCWPEFFERILNGTKTADLRRDDRDFSVGDVLVLEEWDPTTTTHTGSVVSVLITDIVRNAEPFGLVPGFALLSIRLLER